MKSHPKPLRRSGANIMANLILLLGSLSYIMVLAVINGSAGFVSAMGVTLFGAVGIAKALGEPVALSYGMIGALAILCGAVRGVLRFFEQYGNHFIAFKLLAVLRDKIFAALRVLCPAKLESKQKGSLIAMITSDIETLEVFYAHTVSPICIAVIVSTAVFLFVGFAASWYLAWIALLGYLLIGIAAPMISSGQAEGFRRSLSRRIRLLQRLLPGQHPGHPGHRAQQCRQRRAKEVGRRSDVLLEETRRMKRGIARAGAATELTVSLVVLAVLAAGIALVAHDSSPPAG